MTLNDDQIRTAVRENYGKIAASGGRSDGGCRSTGCCGTSAPAPEAVSQAMGYSAEELKAVPEGSNLGLGCGNPQAVAGLRPGETVLDLGSGGGFDCFLAARQVGGTGTVIGVDMTPEMMARARENARKGGYRNVTFRLGEIENLPVGDATVDVIISNCVINLSPDKPRVFAEAFRVLRPGGRLAISDVVATADLPHEVRSDMALYTGCVSGASTIGEQEAILSRIGFEKIVIKPQGTSRDLIREWVPGSRIEDYVVSATIEAVKPIAGCSTVNG